MGASNTGRCLLLEDRTVRCWGQGPQLGYPGDEFVYEPRLTVAVGAPVEQIACGHINTCALLASGAVTCWGEGPLGYGNEEVVGDDETPASAGAVNVGGRVVQLAAGGLRTCALLDGGSVRCWGRSILGYGNSDIVGDDETPADAGDIDVGGPVVQLAAATGWMCALLDHGGVRCWGGSHPGETPGLALGYGSIENIGDDETPANAGDVPLW